MLTKLIPTPVQRLPDRPTTSSSSSSTSATGSGAQSKSVVPTVQAAAPPYGHRKNWIPRRLEDFGDGGAFPEVPRTQYPLNMGIQRQGGETVPMTLDSEGKVRYDALVKQGQRAGKVVHSQFKDLLPKEIDDSDPSFSRPDEEEVKEVTEKTRDALQRLLESKVAAANPVRGADRQEEAQFIRYTPSQQGQQFNSGATQRIVRMVEAQKDPMEPPKFRINTKVPRGPPSPPPTVMHSPPRKVTSKEQAEWKIPPCVSNWKNPKGYAIPLDKRVAADGRGLQTSHINKKFVTLAEALTAAEEKSREAVAMRAKVDSRMQQLERERQEEQLRSIAAAARAQRAGIGAAAAAAGGEEEEEAREREELRRERAADRQRQRNLAKSAKGKAANEEERDISEQIALGRPAVSRDPEAQFDSRLYGAAGAGLASGFHAGEDEVYNVYDQPWRSDAQQQIYRPGKQAIADADIHGQQQQLEREINTRRFVPDRAFDGARSGQQQQQQQRDGPVQFELQHRADAADVGDDPFGLDQFLSKVKQSDQQQASSSATADRYSSASKRHATDSSSSHHSTARKRDKR